MADGVVADRDDRVAQAGGGAGLQWPVAAVGAVAFDGVVALVQERCVDDGQHWAAVMYQGQGCGAERQAVREVRGAVDRVECP